MRKLRASALSSMRAYRFRTIGCTVGAFLDRWLRLNLTGQVSEKTFDSYANTVRLHIAPAVWAGPCCGV